MARTITVPADGRGSARAPKRLLALRGDEHLVEQLRRGNEAAFEVIYERHVPGILSFCRHMLGSLEEAEDAVQHAFSAAHRDLLRDDREIRLKAWLYAIARNRCLSMLRARREQPAEELDASIAGLDDEVERRSELRELVADLQDLPEDQRAALVLSELRDLSHADIAEALGCEVSNVKGLVFRARSGLIERREARGAACDEIQAELAAARGGTLRRGKLRHHLRACPACSGYLEQVRTQRRMLAMILPVAPTVGLREAVLAAVGVGGGASGGGAAAAGGGLLAAALPTGGATVAKVAVVGALVGGAGVAGDAAIDRDPAPAGADQSAVAPGNAGQAPRSPFGGAAPADGASARERAGAGGETPEGAQETKEKKRRKAGGRGRGHAKLPATSPATQAPRKVGQVAPKKVKGVKLPDATAPVGVRPKTPRPGKPERPAPEKPLREPKPKLVPEPAPEPEPVTTAPVAPETPTP